MEELKSLVQRAREGDLDAFGEIVRRFQDMAYGYAYAIVGDSHLAEDAAQEAFLEAYRTLGSLRTPEAFPGWFRPMVLKQCDRILRRKRPLSASVEVAETVASAAPGPHESAERSELRDAVLAAIRGLPEAQRTVTTLFYINGYSQQDIADFLEVPVTTVNNRLHASRRRLKERMMNMVASEVRSSKPGPGFAQLIKQAAALQAQKRYQEALALHREALEAEPNRYAAADSYCSLASSYYAAGDTHALAEGIAAGVPMYPPIGQERYTLRALATVAEGFLRADNPERALRPAARLLELAEILRWCQDYRYWRNEALVQLWWAACQLGDEQAASDRRGEVLENLAAYEADVAAACPGLKRAEDTDDRGLQDWFRAAGDAYYQAAFYLVLRGRPDKKEALRLIRRALELRECPPTHVFLAGLVLSVEGDRQAALAHLGRAREQVGATLVRNWFHDLDDFAPVRDVPEFLELVSS